MAFDWPSKTLIDSKCSSSRNFKRAYPCCWLFTDESIQLSTPPTGQNAEKMTESTERLVRSMNQAKIDNTDFRPGCAPLNANRATITAEVDHMTSKSSEADCQGRQQAKR